MCAVRPLNRIGYLSMALVYTNGKPFIQGQLAIDLGEHTVAVGGEQVALTAALESLLFVAAQPVEPEQLASVLGLNSELVTSALEQLAQQYQQIGRGLRLQARDGKYQLVTMPAAASLIEAFLALDLTTKLSGAALETLALIAYRQPVTRAQIEAVRGVDSAGVLRSLLQRGLIEEISRLEVAGRPILYGVTDLFLQHFGLTSLEQLPPLDAPDMDLLASATQLANLEEASA
jgi:segregation and condensation protein B